MDEEIKQEIAEKEGFKWGRFIGSVLIILAFFSVLSLTVLYLIWVKAQVNWIVMVTGLTLPVLISGGWFYTVAKASQQKSMLEFIEKGAKLVSDKNSQVTSVTAGNITVANNSVPSSAIPGSQR